MGSVQIATTLYTIRPISDGLSVIYTLEPLEWEGPDVLNQDSGAASGLERIEAAISDDRNEALLLNTVVDVMLVRTQDAEDIIYDNYTSLTAFYNHILSTTNNIYANSNIPITLQRVYSSRLAYDQDDGTWDQNLVRLLTRGDGHMDAVFNWRDDNLADVVVLFTDGPGTGTGGIANEHFGPPARAYAIVSLAANWAIQRGAFAHEIGHLQGAGHDEFSPPLNDVFPYGFGYFAGSGSNAFRTAMAYEQVCNACPLAGMFSSPDLTHNGLPAGTSMHDNARVLRETRHTIADHREPLRLNMGGPGEVKPRQHFGFCEWQAIARGGWGTKSYTWRHNGNVAGVGPRFSPRGGTGEEDFTLKLTVSDASGSKSVTRTIAVRDVAAPCTNNPLASPPEDGGEGAQESN